MGVDAPAVEDQAVVNRGRGKRGARGCAVALFLAASSYALACGGAKKSQSDPALPPQVALHGVTLHAWEGNELTAVGTAREMTYDRSSGNFEASGAQVRFPSSTSTARASRPLTADLEVTAPRVSGNLPSRQAEGKGGITARSTAGLVAQTPSARFDGQGLVAQGKEPVEITGPGYALDAQGFTFYLLTEELVFERGVHSRLGPAETPE